MTTMTDHRKISREDLELVRLLAAGLSLESVARRLNLSERTVRRRMRALCDRLGLDNPHRGSRLGGAARPALTIWLRLHRGWPASDISLTDCPTGASLRLAPETF